MDSTQTNKGHRYRKETGGCQRQGVEVGEEIGEGGQKVKMKIKCQGSHCWFLEMVVTMTFSDFFIEQLSLISTRTQSESLLDTNWVTYKRDPAQGI